MPPAPLLPSFRIQGFRAFRDLQIPRLGRVNLLVGKNNVGKTTALEALKVYAAGAAAPWEIRDLLERRQEIRRGAPREKTSPQIDIDRMFFQSAHHGRTSAIQLGSVEEEAPLRIQSGHLLSNASISLLPFDGVFYATDEELPDIFQNRSAVLRVSRGTVPIQFALLRSLTDINSSDFVDMLTGRIPEAGSSLTCELLPARGIDRASIGALWDSIVLTANEQSTLQALRIIAPDIERISLVEDPRQQGVRYALISRQGHSSPEPLHSMGDGMNRVFELALGLVSAKDGLFLIDEVENGVHYAAQEQLWRFIFEAASQLGVQVFATTHSWDCITAFQKAASSHPEDGMLISLTQVDGDIKAAVFNERDLEIITRESIEVR
ncbi:ATP-binding protein [Corallococcus praedator]|uniref:ATP-binding protein n=1 Tax=Corallococcus praedator TaxID=2316724 RepID=A0ABX9QIX6_9BACT|nr:MULTISPECIES: ATP-binding protein [Corallococcus]RKH34300.1 ATP-binding protein [Corallococcus sp. CA031C]RKI09272.1 ATP-binding protein [Corallococcus praedator]